MKKKSSTLTLLLLAGIIAIGYAYNGRETQSTTAPSSAPVATASTSQHTGAQETEPTTASTATSSASSQEGLEIPHYQSSRGGQIIKHVGFTLSYDADFKTPQWVAWTLTDAETQGSVPRGKKFLPDPAIRGAKAYHTDYTNSGYDRGHMAPAGDMKWSKRAMEESFYLSNVCPQNQNLNRGDWKDLEEAERAWAVRYGAVSITAGPIYYTKNPPRIGANKVAVPDAFYKVLLIGYPNQPKTYGFIFRNAAGSHPLSYYQLSVDEVEEATGIDFFPALPDDVEQRIEAQKPALP